MSSTFTPEDLAALEKTQKMRERLADVIMAKPDNELPRKPAELTAVTNLLESIDRSILGRTKMRIDDDTSKNDAQNKELLRELMIQLHQTPKPLIVIEADGQATQNTNAPSYSPSVSSVSPGELIFKTDTPELPQELQ